MVKKANMSNPNLSPHGKNRRLDGKLKQLHHLLGKVLGDQTVAGKHKPKNSQPVPRSFGSRGPFVDQVVEQVRQLIQRYQALHHKYLTHLADAENYKKQLVAEQQEVIKYRAVGIAQHLLPALDSFEIALAQKQSDPVVRNYLEGFRMIYRLIADAFAREGIKIIPTKTGDVFDHNIHNATTTEYQSGVEPHRILRVVKKGYRLSERVLRHSVVVVSAPSPAPIAEPKQQVKQKQEKERKE